MTEPVSSRTFTRTIDRVDPTAMKVVASLMEDPNPIHWDVNAVHALGLGDRPVNQGPITVSYLLDLACTMVGDTARVEHFTSRFLDSVFAGDRIVCSGFWHDETTIRLTAMVEQKIVVEAQAKIKVI